MKEIWAKKVLTVSKIPKQNSHQLIKRILKMTVNSLLLSQKERKELSGVKWYLSTNNSQICLQIVPNEDKEEQTSKGRQQMLKVKLKQVGCHSKID